MSLLVALTLTPALCFALLGGKLDNADDPPLIKRIKPLYQSLLGAVFRHFNSLIICGIIICLSGLFAFFSLLIPARAPFSCKLFPFFRTHLLPLLYRIIPVMPVSPASMMPATYS